MLPPTLPNPNFVSPFPLPPIEDIRPYLWSQRLLTSLSVNQTRGQLVHCPYYKPFSLLDSGAPSPPFLATADHYFEWRSVYTNHTLAVVTFIVHLAFSQEKPHVLFDKHPVFSCESCIISWWVSGPLCAETTPGNDSSLRVTNRFLSSLPLLTETTMNH